MNLKQGVNTSKGILIIIIAAAIAGGGILAYQYMWPIEGIDKKGIVQEVTEILKDQKSKPIEYSAERVPDFKDFPISEIYEGEIVDPDFETDEKAYTFRGAIKKGIKTSPNFAGHYTVILWGCGTDCQSGVVVNAKTGAIYWLPVSEFRRDFRVDSSLLIANSPETIESRYPYYPYKKDGSVEEWVSTRYYKWENDQFVLVYKSSDYKIPEDKVVEITNWETHKSEAFKFEIKYPQGWTVKEDILSKTHLGTVLSEYLYISDNSVPETT